MLDTTSWQGFKIGDFFDIRPTKTYKGLAADDLNDGGRTPFVVNSSVNNGIGGFSTLPPTEEGNKITFSDTTDGNTFFYQPSPFIGFSHVQGMYANDKHHWTQEELLFLATILTFDSVGRYNYGRKMTRETIKSRDVLLPVALDGEPDWQYMQDFIKSLNHKPLTTENPVPSSRAADLKQDNWAWFSLGGPNGLFDIKKGKRLTAADQTEGTTPYIGAIESNNGVSNRIGQSAIHGGNTISLSYNGSVGEAFYQPDPYWSTDDVNALYLRPEYGELTPATGLFISTVLRQEKYRFSYGRKWTLDNMNATSIQLPATPGGEPDWQFMEDYMRSLPYGDRIPEVGD